jgi:hypothetical protein
MTVVLKSILTYFLIAVIGTTVFANYLRLSGYPGGGVGMAPILAMITYLISFFISLAIISIIQFLLKYNLTLSKSNLIFVALYSLILAFYFGANPFETGIGRMDSDVNVWVHLSGIISLCVINGISFFTRKLNL